MNYNNKHTNIFIFLITILYLSSLCLSRINILNGLGTISLIMLFSFSIVFIFNKKIKIKSRYLSILLIIFCVLIVFNTQNILSFAVIKQFVFLIILIFSFLTFSNRFNYKDINFFIYRCINFVFFLFVTLGFILLKRNNNILFPNTAGIAHISFISIVFNYYLYKENKTKKIDFLIYFPLLVLSNGRIQIFSLIFMFIFIKFRKNRVKNKFFYICMFLIFVICTFLITYYYPKIYHNQLFYDVNLKVREITKKNLFSGRQYLWENALNNVRGHEIWGLGTDGSFEDIHYNNQISIHNQYLQVYYNHGLVGVIVVLLILGKIWMMLYKYTSKKTGMLVVLYFYSFLIINIFSVSLLQNNTFVACYFWSSLGIMLSILNNKIIDKEKENENRNYYIS